LDKPEYVVPQEGNSGNYNNTTTTDAEVQLRPPQAVFPLRSLSKTQNS